MHLHRFPERRPRVLVVEPDLPQRVLLSLMLERAGYAPTAVASAERALERLTSGRADVVLADVAAPGRGLALIAVLRVEAPGLPTVATAGVADDDLSRGALLLGARTVLTRPIDFDALRHALDAAVGAPAADLLPAA